MKYFRFILLINFITILSCLTDEIRKTYTVTDANETIIDTLYPIKDKNYTTKIIKLMGETNDSIYISVDKGYKIYFIGNIDTSVNLDYYGKYPVIFEFNPYKATNVNLNIEFTIL